MPAPAAAATAPIWPKAVSAIGAGLSGIGSMISGFQGSPYSAHDAYRQMLIQQEYDDYTKYKHIPQIVAGAKKVGIHPLAALGVNVGAGQIQRVSGGRKDIGKALRGMGQSMSSYGETKLRMDLLRAEIQKTQAEATAIEADTAGKGKGNIPVDALGVSGQSSGSVQGSGPEIGYEISRKPVSRRLGVEKFAGPMYQEVYDPDGYISRTYTQNISEALENDTVVKGRQNAIHLHRIGRGWWNAIFGGSPEYVGALLRQRATHQKIKGTWLIHNIKRGQWKRVNYKPNRLFEDIDVPIDYHGRKIMRTKSSHRRVRPAEIGNKLFR